VAGRPLLRISRLIRVTDTVEEARGDSGPEVAALVASRTLDVPDFPKPGIMFKDLMPLFADGRVFREITDAVIAHHGADSFDVVAGIEARGFLLAASIAYATGKGVVPIRKAGKLPREVISASYALEYGEAALEVHTDAFVRGHRVLVVDDVLATGGTAGAALDLVERAGGVIAGCTVLLELGFLPGRANLAPREVHALLTV
jgi:adenine phosphoribosyltransferase